MAERSAVRNETIWPNFAKAAEVLGIDRSTLTKQAQAGRVRFVERGLGRGERLIPPVEVLRLARAYRRTAIEEVRRRLARVMAARGGVPESVVLQDLEALPAGQFAPRPMVNRGLAGPRIAKPRRSVPSQTDQVGQEGVGLERLEPRPVQEGELLPDEMIRSFDAVRPCDPEMEILDPDPEHVWLGRLQPGDRF